MAPAISGTDIAKCGCSRADSIMACLVAGRFSKRIPPSFSSVGSCGASCSACWCFPRRACCNRCWLRHTAPFQIYNGIPASQHTKLPLALPAYTLRGWLAANGMLAETSLAPHVATEYLQVGTQSHVVHGPGSGPRTDVQVCKQNLAECLTQLSTSSVGGRAAEADAVAARRQRRQSREAETKRNRRRGSMMCTSFCVRAPGSCRSSRESW